MCGVVRTNNSDRELVVAHQEAPVMPPSVTVPVGGTEPPKTTPSTEIPCHIAQQQPEGAVSNKEIPTIDLAADENDDLQKAIALSLQETTEPSAMPLAGISTEEQDVSKALEVSLQDSGSSTTIDIINPKDRKRENGVPVGLRNIGNSCWFNVVIQPLFFIPLFRDMIINYPKDLNEVDISKSPNKRVVPALRSLFSLLIGSVKKYIDPTESVNLFQGQEMRKNTQQDVCEFIHKLLEKLEEEFKLLLKKQGIEKESSEASKEANFENPILKLFYGQLRRESIEDESDDTKLETFGQYPLTVMKYKDIHESIHASMAGENSDESYNDDNPEQKSKKCDSRMWFKNLPSVLIFSLSRYQYSKEKKRPEKVHNKFEFHEYLFMDRYMESNKEIVKEKHAKIAKIKEELSSLYNVLEKYQRFGSGDSKYPIADILKYALEFAGSQASKSEESNMLNPNVMEVDLSEFSETDVEMIDSKEKELRSHKEETISVNCEDELPTSPEYSQESSVHISPNKKQRVLSPAPQTLFPGELPVLQACLPRWQKEVELQVNYLKKSIEGLENELKLIYEEPSLHHIPYKLHAVVVHEGQASGGHYWVYIYDNSRNLWMKFNDIQVTESNWQELLQDSIGGQNNASAYCLMYIDQTRYNRLFSSAKLDMSTLSYLPLDLQEYVKQENLAFKRELEEWDAKQEQQSAAMNNEADTRAIPATAPNSPELLHIDEEETNFFLEIQTMLSQTLTKAFENEDAILQEKNRTQWLLEIVNTEISRLKDLAIQKLPDDSYSESSLLDLGIYLTKNKEKDILLHWYAFEMVWHIAQTKNSKAMNMICHEAVKYLQHIRDKYLPALGSTYQGWKKHYQSLVTCAWYFVYGYRKYQNGHAEVALVHLIYAIKLHKQIKDNPPQGNAKTLDFRVLGYCHRKLLQVANEKLVEAFLKAETETKAIEVAQTVSKVIPPAIWYVNNSKNSEDEIVGNYVRNRWCQIIEMVSSNKVSLIEQILNILTNEGSEVTTKISLKIPSVPQVLSLYKEYKDSVTILMSNYEEAQTSDL
ncbi:UNVERIFIED_CONTAM: hypothetical protein RMT77_002237 [Armadillidium vulgare]